MDHRGTGLCPACTEWQKARAEDALVEKCYECDRPGLKVGSNGGGTCVTCGSPFCAQHSATYESWMPGTSQVLANGMVVNNPGHYVRVVDSSAQHCGNCQGDYNRALAAWVDAAESQELAIMQEARARFSELVARLFANAQLVTERYNSELRQQRARNEGKPWKTGSDSYSSRRLFWCQLESGIRVELPEGNFALLRGGRVSDVVGMAEKPPRQNLRWPGYTSARVDDSLRGVDQNVWSRLDTKAQDALACWVYERCRSLGLL